MKCNIIIEDGLLIDVLTTAFEGGSNYWYCITTDVQGIRKRFHPDEREKPLSQLIGRYILEKQGRIEIADNKEIEENEGLNSHLGELSGRSIFAAIENISKSKDYSYVLGNILSENYDAADADVFLQFAVMGKVVYG